MKSLLIPVIAAAALGVAGQALAADPAAGKTAYQIKGCVGCHGPQGKSTNPANPALDGKEADYLQEQLVAFRAGKRQNATMNAMAAMLSDEDIANIAAYLARQ